MITKETVIIAVAIYLVVMNIIAFASMGIDKKKAMKGAWRIPEKSLFLPVILGGSLGGVLGMKHFRHKTKHWYFQYGFPMFLVIDIAVLGFLVYKFVL